VRHCRIGRESTILIEYKRSAGHPPRGALATYAPDTKMDGEVYMIKKTPQDLYQMEKKRAERDRSATHAALMKDAKAAFDQLIEDGKAARKGGRPKGSKTRKD